MDIQSSVCLGRFAFKIGTRFGVWAIICSSEGLNTSYITFPAIPLEGPYSLASAKPGSPSRARRIARTNAGVLTLVPPRSRRRDL